MQNSKLPTLQLVDFTSWVEPYLGGFRRKNRTGFALASPKLVVSIVRKGDERYIVAAMFECRPGLMAMAYGMSGTDH